MHAQRHQVVHDVVFAGHRREHRADAPGLVAPGDFFESEMVLGAGVVTGSPQSVGAIVADWHANPMAWGERKRQGNIGAVALTLPLPPGRSRWARQHSLCRGRLVSIDTRMPTDSSNRPGAEEAPSQLLPRCLGAFSAPGRYLHEMFRGYASISRPRPRVPDIPPSCARDRCRAHAR